MHSLLTAIAQQRVAELHRAAEHDRLVHAATAATASHTVPTHRHATTAPVGFARWLRRRLGSITAGV